MKSKGHKFILVIVSPGGLHYANTFRSLKNSLDAALNEIDNGSHIDEFYEADSKGNMIRSIAPQWLGAYRRTGVLGHWANSEKIHL